MENKFEGMSVKKIIKKTRHKAELPLAWISIILSSVIFLAIGFAVELTSDDLQFRAELLDLVDGDEFIVELLSSLGIGCSLIAVLAIALLLLYALYQQYAEIMAYCVKVTPVNFPQIYDKAREFSEKLGLKKQPEIYVGQENGAINAFASFVLGKRYIKLNSDIVDIAYLENNDFETVYFTMAHEFGHVYLKHANLFYNVFTFVSRLIPIYGPLLSRAQEYSADRVAQALTDNFNADKCMSLLATGKHLYKYVDINDYLDTAEKNHNIIERISRFILNLFASHPINPFRVKAILDPDRKSGRLI